MSCIGYRIPLRSEAQTIFRESTLRALSYQIMNWNKSASASSSISPALPRSLSRSPSCCGGVKCNDSSASFPAYLCPRLASPPHSCIIIIISHHKQKHTDAAQQERLLIRATRLTERLFREGFFLQPAKFPSMSVFLVRCLYNLLSPRSSGMTECKYSLYVFHLKATLPRHAQTFSV